MTHCKYCGIQRTEPHAENRCSSIMSHSRQHKWVEKGERETAAPEPGSPEWNEAQWAKVDWDAKPETERAREALEALNELEKRATVKGSEVNALVHSWAAIVRAALGATAAQPEAWREEWYHEKHGWMFIRLHERKPVLLQDSVERRLIPLVRSPSLPVAPSEPGLDSDEHRAACKLVERYGGVVVAKSEWDRLICERAAVALSEEEKKDE